MRSQDDQVIFSSSESSEPVPRFHEVTPTKKQAKQFNFAHGEPESASEALVETESDTMTEDKWRKHFWEIRQQYKNHFCKNRIVELCYGSNGLLQFLDLMFTQFPDRRYVKLKFNYYFALRKQMQAIEQQIVTELEQTNCQEYINWYERHAGLLTGLTPQLEAAIKNEPLNQSPIF